MEEGIQTILGILLWIEVVTLDKISFFLGVGFLILFSACGTKDITKSYETTHANRLLSADSTKVWSLISRQQNGEDAFGPCTENNTLTFVKATTDSLYITGRPATCGSPDPLAIMYQAKYTLDGDERNIFLNSISLTEEEFQTIGSMQVDELTSTFLKLTYTQNGSTIVESYSN
ncbi:hypothetical protein [Reichenbachiella sp.]|uniref:hypothetical protein n=1 Tax=Reichenbachiella sp. TaxID=2184521 RepID=UPI003B5CBEBF